MKGPNFYNLLVILSFMFISFNATGIESKWQILHQNDEVIIETKNYNCDFSDAYDQEFIFLKITNLTESSLTLKYSLKLWYDNECINCDSNKPEYEKLFKLNPKETITSNCYERLNQSKIFVKFSMPLEKMPGVNKIVKLTNFEINNIRVEYE